MAVKQPADAADSQHQPTADEGRGSRRLLGWDGIQQLLSRPGHHQASAETRSGGFAPTKTRAGLISAQGRVFSQRTGD